MGVDENLSIILDRVTGAGENVFKVALNGNNVREIKLTAKPYDLQGSGREAEQVLPRACSHPRRPRRDNSHG